MGPRAPEPCANLHAREPPAQARWWPRALKWLTWALVVLVAGLLVHQSRDIEWKQVAGALGAYSGSTLALAAALAAASHALYSSFDLIGRRYTQHRMAAPRVMAVAFISYVFNLNFGSLVGAVAMRFSLYTRAGLSAGVAAQIFALSVATNWLGYGLLAGTLLLLHPPALPPHWPLGATGLRLFGALMLLLAAAYIVACAAAPKRRWHSRAHSFALPTLRMALWQAAAATANWLLNAAIVFVLLGHLGADFSNVLGVALIAAVAGVISHIPAGLGVLEVVYLALLAPRLGTPAVLAALLAYRALYYLAPLLPALALWLLLNRRPGTLIAP